MVHLILSFMMRKVLICEKGINRLVQNGKNQEKRDAAGNKTGKSAYRCCEVCVKAVVRYRLRYDKVKEEEKGDKVKE